MDAKTLTDQSVQAECECVVAEAERRLKAASEVRADADDLVRHLANEMRQWASIDREIEAARVQSVKASLAAKLPIIFDLSPPRSEVVESRAYTAALLAAARVAAADFAEDETRARCALDAATAHATAAANEED